MGSHKRRVDSASVISFSVFSSGLPSPAVTQKPSSVPIRRTSYHNSAASQTSAPKQVQPKPSASKQENVISQTNTGKPAPPLNHLNKDQRLKEEERLLLSKIHQMTGDTSPFSGHRSMKRLIPDPRDINCDTTQLLDCNQYSITPSFDTLQKISHAASEEPLSKLVGQNPDREDDV